VLPQIERDSNGRGHFRPKHAIARRLEAHDCDVVNDVVPNLRFRINGRDAAREFLAGIGVDGEPGLLAVLDTADICLVDIGPNFEAGQIDERQERRRRETCGNRLALLRRNGGDRTCNRCDDTGIVQLGGRIRKGCLRDADLLLRHRAGAFREIQLAGRDDVGGVQLAFALQVGLGVAQLGAHTLHVGGGFIPTCDEIAVVQFGEQLSFLDRVADFDVKALHDAGQA